MTKILLLIVLISGSDLSESLRPSLFSVDGVGVQAGAGWCVGYPMVPSFEASVLQIRSYWGQKLAFSLGAELAHGHVAGGVQQGKIYAVLPLLEILTPQIGLGVFGGTNPILPYKSGRVEHLTPLVKLSSGVSILNLSPDNPLLCSTLRSELSLELNRILWVQFTHRWLPYYSGERKWGRSLYNHSFHLGLCLTLGARDVRRFKEVKERRIRWEK
ncbi:hypothetical protein CEE36_11505 [candidate division TA06 bacterium B3_TA06]|uniref:Uncharacterized protein n=1 Tax=candidate division TA06 bacterium B3_TA06 TaxID=2012487 RepID=A0A532UNP1_UNCT6|nr:MAG: hypothetical protein CEE36_11505 [candidate division TA06 bacterium B3_TA06]